MPGQLGADDGRERRDPVLVALAGADNDLMPPEIDVLYPEPSALQKTQAGAIQQDGHEAGSAAELTENRPHLVAGEHDWQSSWPPGPHDVVEPGHLLLKNLAIEEEQGAQRLILGGRGDVPLDGQRAQIPRELRGAHLGGMTLPVEEDLAPYPGDVGLFGPPAIVTGTDGVANPVEKARGPVGGRRRLARDERGPRHRGCHGRAGFTHR